MAKHKTTKRMGIEKCIKCICVCTFVVFVVCVGAETKARLINNGYEGVVVAISQEVDEKYAPQLIATIKEMIEEASRRLYLATHKRAYFRSVKILIPKSWTNTNVSDNALNENFEDSDIRVDLANSIYAHQPYTLQTGGCGEPGRYIHITPQYLMDNTIAAWYGPRGKALLIEWAKQHWGVFDELGYPGDPTFPLFYMFDNGNRGGDSLLPTYCADITVEGRLIDKQGRSACGLTYSGEPDSDCRFIPYNYQEAASSLMSYAFIFSDSVVDFCDSESSTRPHNSVAPTKQNVFCGGRSVWQVMMQHKDFANGRNLATDTYEEPHIEVVQHTDANYALVLDYSGSMNDNYRVHKLRKTARRWLLHEVATGSYVAIVRFSKHASLVHQLERITDIDSRERLANSIETKADGGTSIGAGLYVAVKTILAGRKNPVILLITDGEENENPRIDDIMKNVIESGVRVITVAFGAQADPKLEQVAHTTGGKTFTVNDLDEGHMLEDAFHGALTYQPPPPRRDTTVTIHEEVHRGSEREAESSFNVDFTVGRNLTLRLHTDDRYHITQPPSLLSPSGLIIDDAQFDVKTFTWTIKVPNAEEGRWVWRVGLSGNNERFVRVKVTSQPRNPEVHPITTKAWVSSGTKDVNAIVDKVAIYAEVKQGNNPVINAHVRALVTPPNENEPPKVYDLLDNGQGADTLAGDGIYSRYMTQYSGTGRYSVKAQVTDGGTAVINKGFLTATERRKRSTVDYMDRPDICCGSFVPVNKDNTQETGTFSRFTVAGSIRVTEIAEVDTQPPAEVRDLRASLIYQVKDDDLPVGLHQIPGQEVTRGHHYIKLIWTAPGDDLDLGSVSGYTMRMTHNRSALSETTFDTAQDDTLIDLSGHAIYGEAGDLINITVPVTLTSHHTVYVAMRAYDDVGTYSPVSNIAVIIREVTSEPIPPHHTVAFPIWGIIVIIIFATLMVVFVCVAMGSRKHGKYECVEPKALYDRKLVT